MTIPSTIKRACIFIFATFLCSCWFRGPAAIPLSEAGAKVEAAMTPAPNNYIEIGPVFGQHGGDCEPGNRQDAINDLRNKAAALGAQYVRMDSFRLPDDALQCRNQEYIIRGVAYRREF